MSTAYADTPVAQLVTDRPDRFRVFEKWGLDYCCGGGDPLGEACRAKGIDEDAVAADLAKADGTEPAEGERGWAAASIPELVDHIVSTHHGYVRRALPELRSLSATVLKAHGERHPALAEVRETVLALADELEAHLMKEEQILFPICIELAAATERPTFHCGSVANPIRVMEHEHDSAGRALARLAEITGGFTAPEDGCPTYAAFMHSIAELEVDLHRHIHKENHVLFPRALALEASLA